MSAKKPAAAKAKAGDAKDQKKGGGSGGGAKAKAKGGDAPAPGDKPKLFGGSPSDQKVLIADVIDLIGAHDRARVLLKIAQSELVIAFQKQPALSPANLYRKQYGNLKEMFNAEKRFAEVFAFDGDIVCLRPVTALEAAAASGLISAETLRKCHALHLAKEKHDAETLKVNGENRCARCGANYKVLINVDGPNALCTITPAGAGAGAAPQKTRHVPAFDFAKSANDVLACAVTYPGVDLKTTAPAAASAAADK